MYTTKRLDQVGPFCYTFQYDKNSLIEIMWAKLLCSIRIRTFQILCKQNEIQFGKVVQVLSPKDQGITCFWSFVGNQSTVKSAGSASFSPLSLQCRNLQEIFKWLRLFICVVLVLCLWDSFVGWFNPVLVDINGVANYSSPSGPLVPQLPSFLFQRLSGSKFGAIFNQTGYTQKKREQLGIPISSGHSNGKTGIQ